jgi:nucleoside-diphosphate-sugar epimerase
MPLDYRKPRMFLVTGGTGFLGSALVRGLVAKGQRVRTLDNDTRGRRSRLADLGPAVDVRIGDIRDPATVAEAVAGVDCVCHLAYINGTEFFYSIPETVLDVGVRGMLNILDACRHHGVRDLVLASSSEVYQDAAVVPTNETVPLIVPDPLNPRYSYGGGKIISELLAINYGRKSFERVAIFRPHNIFGPDMGWEHVIPQFALRGSFLARNHPHGVLDFPIKGNGTATRAFMPIDDFVAAALCVIDVGEHLGIYHIGVESEITVAELASRVGQCLGRLIRIVPSDPPRGEARRRCPDTHKLRSLGFRPQVDFMTALKSTVDWYAANTAVAPDRVVKSL